MSKLKYIDHSSIFFEEINTLKTLDQYKDIYNVRFKALSPKLINVASEKWPNNKIQNKIEDCKDLSKCILIGITYKDMFNKPNPIKENYYESLKRDNYISTNFKDSKEDIIYLEDSRAKVKLCFDELVNDKIFNIDCLYSGIVLAVL